MDNMIRVKMDWSYRYQGRMYGPGSAVLVPQALASAMHLQSSAEPLEPEEPAVNEHGQALPSIRALTQHLNTLNTREQVEALMAIDTRKSAEKLYDTRLSQLEAE